MTKKLKKAPFTKIKQITIENIDINNILVSKKNHMVIKFG